MLHVLGYASAAGHSAGVTGVERIVDSLLVGLGHEFEQHVVYPMPGRMQARYQERAASVVSAAPARHLDLAFVRLLADRMRDLHIDVVVSHGNRFDFHAAIAARRTGVAHVVRRPVALADEEFASWRRPLIHGIDGWILRRTRAVIAVSEASKRRMVETQRVDAAHIEVIANGVAMNGNGRPDRDTARREFGVEDDVFVIGGVGQLIARKAFHLLIEAVARLRDDVPALTAVVVLVGDGPERERLRALATARGVRLVLTGYRDQPQALLSAFDVAVLPSRAEGMPLVLLEAMAVGVPCVATPAAGSVEVVEDGVSGLLVPFDDVVALAAALRRLAIDAPARQRMGAAAASRIASQFSLQAMWGRYRELLLRVTRGRARVNARLS